MTIYLASECPWQSHDVNSCIEFKRKRGIKIKCDRCAREIETTEEELLRLLTTSQGARA